MWEVTPFIADFQSSTVIFNITCRSGGFNFVHKSCFLNQRIVTHSPLPRNVMNSPVVALNLAPKPLGNLYSITAPKALVTLVVMVPFLMIFCKASAAASFTFAAPHSFCRMLPDSPIMFGCFVNAPPTFVSGPLLNNWSELQPQSGLKLQTVI